MNFFAFDLKKWLLIAAVIAVPLFTINLARDPAGSQWLATPLGWINSGVQQVYFGFANEVRGNTRYYLDLIGIKNENAALRKEVAEVKAQMLDRSELVTENNRLTELLGFKQKTKMDLLAARIISRDMLLDHVTVQIDRGTEDGLKVGQAVITTDGVVGHVFRPDPYTSQVLLLTDRYAVIDGLVQRSRARGIVEGRSASRCAFRYVERSEDVVEGDLVVTSGLDDIFPKGFPVAKVVKVEKRSQDVSLRVELQPVVDPQKLEEVFIVLNAKKEDFTPAPPEEATPTEAEASQRKGGTPEA